MTEEDMRIKIYELKANLLCTLAHANRIRILEFLKNGEKCNSEIYPALNMEQSNLSRHLRILLDNDVIMTRKEGLRVYYQIVDKSIFNILDMATEIVRNNLKRNLEIIDQIEG